MATEYISRDAACEQLRLFMTTDNEPRTEADDWLDFAIAAIARLVPAADVVEVVRCKNCAFWNKEDSQPNGCLCEHWSGADALWYTPHDSFFSDGIKAVKIDQVKEGSE